ncbi:hypothetical protein Pla175_49180 [Pirellulimonas nuda]|uniref:DUF368 domain-containing protein n=1 Tax=Pirellulimonas nuda TaxID=2528009 RepID=A0A518DJ29_9BACT|nr:DUF368 domain-containing protein [Pirellulimonas nuda]QDU91489.1 hypothetical protein Pla175_49180 [Pirellulimonas nuda]
MPRAADFLNILRGLLMGAADIVPGVSGGTVALVLGIYQRLVTAISRFDREAVRLVLKGRLADAATHVDLRFLATLGAGIGIGVVGLARLMHYLLEHHHNATSAAFFGLILGSSLLVLAMVRPATHGGAAGAVVVGLAAAGFAYWLVGLERVEPAAGLPYTFFCGAIAICAMILPGISGAYILLLLGKYEQITGILKGLPHGEATTGDLATLAVFAAGCAIGLALFSRVIRWLLANCWSVTMAALCGFMVGSLRMVWPWQRDLTPAVEELKQKTFEPYWPTTLDGESLLYIALAAAGLLLVLGLQWLGAVGPAPAPHEGEPSA